MKIQLDIEDKGERMGTQHTPGPWELRFSTRGYWFIDHERGGESYTLTKLEDCTNEADARLIAAAPELLTALQNCVNVLSLALPLFDDESTDDKDSREEVGSVLGAARDALAKATGGVR